MDSLLKYFITKSCLLQGHNLEEACVVPPNIGAELRERDKEEEYFHVETFPKEGMHDETTVVYRKRAWLQAVARIAEQKRLSEIERQQSLARQEQEKQDNFLKDEAFKTARRTLNLRGKTDREIESLLKLCLNGDLPKVAEGLGISKWCRVKQNNIELLEKEFE